MIDSQGSALGPSDVTAMPTRSVAAQKRTRGHWLSESRTLLVFLRRFVLCHVAIGNKRVLGRSQGLADPGVPHMLPFERGDLLKLCRDMEVMATLARNLRKPKVPKMN